MLYSMQSFWIGFSLSNIRELVSSKSLHGSFPFSTEWYSIAKIYHSLFIHPLKEIFVAPKVRQLWINAFIFCVKFLCGQMKETDDETRLCFQKQRHHFAKVHKSKNAMVFSDSHVWMRVLDHKEGWALKNWCFWIVLEKTLESPLDCKEIKQANPKGKQPWIFIGRTDAEAETPILWPPD